MKHWYSAFELAGLAGLPALPNNVARKARAERWQTRQRSGRGGGKEYAYNSLPQQTQAALMQESVVSETEACASTLSDRAMAHPTVERQLHRSVKTNTEQRTDAWLAILRAYESWCDRSAGTVLDRDIAFIRAYNNRELVLSSWVYAYLPNLSRSSLKAKQKLRREATKIIALGGNHGHRRGTGRIDSDPDNLDVDSEDLRCLPGHPEQKPFIERFNRTIQNPRELDFLMMAAPGKQGTRRVGRQGISIYGRLYVSAELTSWIGRTVFVCFDPQQPLNVYVYHCDRLTEFICQAVWRDAADINLAEIAHQARHLYEVLLRSVNQIRKRGKALLCKLEYLNYRSNPHPTILLLNADYPKRLCESTKLSVGSAIILLIKF